MSKTEPKNWEWAARKEGGKAGKRCVLKLSERSISRRREWSTRSSAPTRSQEMRTEKWSAGLATWRALVTWRSAVWMAWLGICGELEERSWISRHMQYFQRLWPERDGGASLEVQWLRICLAIQGTWVWSLIQEDPPCCRATKLLRPATEAHTLRALLHNKRSQSNEEPKNHQWVDPACCNYEKATSSDEDRVQLKKKIK